MDVKEWVKKEIEKGEDLEVIKGALEILGFDSKIVDNILKDIKKKEEIKIKEKKRDVVEKKEQLSQKNNKEEQHYLNEEPVEVLELHVSRDLLPKHHEQKIKEVKRYSAYLIIFLGISLVLIGLYLFYFIKG